VKNLATDNVGYSTELRYFTQQQNILSNIAPDYINKLTKNLENRFSETGILECMKVLIPENICSTDSVAKYGVQEQLAAHSSTQQSRAHNRVPDVQTFSEGQLQQV